MASELTQLRKNCSGKNCPAVYVNADGDFVVRGYILDALLEQQLELPSGETAVVVPRGLLQGLQ
jgi:hypothetical protein